MLNHSKLGADVRFGSKADMCSATRYVRFPPKADMCSALDDVCFVPIADIALLFDDLVGAREQRGRTEKPGRAAAILLNR